MSFERSEQRPDLNEVFIQDKAVEDIITTIRKIRGTTPDNTPRGIIDLRKLPVNPSMQVEEREEEIERNNRVYYRVLHDPRLREQSIYPDMETVVEVEVPMKNGWFHMSSIRLGDEASLVRMTVHNGKDEPTEFRAHLWYPARSAEEKMFDYAQRHN